MGISYRMQHAHEELNCLYKSPTSYILPAGTSLKRLFGATSHYCTLLVHQRIITKSDWMCHNPGALHKRIITNDAQRVWQLLPVKICVMEGLTWTERWQNCPNHCPDAFGELTGDHGVSWTTPIQYFHCRGNKQGEWWERKKQRQNIKWGETP